MPKANEEKVHIIHSLQTEFLHPYTTTHDKISSLFQMLGFVETTNIVSNSSQALLIRITVVF